MKLHILAFVFLCGVVSSNLLQKIPKVTVASTDTTTKYIIFDTDVGDDDAWALFMLLKADHIGKVKILAITCVNGNTQVDNVTRNTIRILEFSNRTDIPVYRGAMSPFIDDIAQKDPPYNGYDGFGDVYTEQPDINLLQPENAITAMYNIVKKYPNRVTLVATGPQTNVALAIKTYSDFSENVKEIFIMGGNYNAIGNTIRPTVEFNFYIDPVAAYIVLNNIQRPITILPWEACLEENLNITISWRFDVFGQLDNPIVKFMNPVDTVIHADKGDTTWAPADMLLIASMLNPKAVVKRAADRNATVELYGSETRGQVVIDHSNLQAFKNVHMIELVDKQGIINMALWTVEYKNFPF